jgi:hypothetical protein
MPGAMPGIHDFSFPQWKTWMAGTSPAMTNGYISHHAMSRHAPFFSAESNTASSAATV